MTGSMTRIATYDDMEKMVVLAKEFHEISPFKSFRFSPSGTRNYFTSMMQSPSAVIIMHDDGFIGGGFSEYPFCEMVIAKEAFWYSRKEGLGGLPLLRKYVEWLDGKPVNIDLLSSLEIEGRRSDLVERLLRMNGYRLVEQTYMRVV